MSRIHNLTSALLTAVTLVVLAACTPKVNYPGKQVTKPGFIEKQYVAEDGAVLPVRSWLPQDGPARAVIVAVHGFNDYSNAFTSPGSYLGRA